MCNAAWVNAGPKIREEGSVHLAQSQHEELFPFLQARGYSSKRSPENAPLQRQLVGGAGHNSGAKTLGFRALLARNDPTRLGCSFGRYSKPVRLPLEPNFTNFPRTRPALDG
jgi:hypothetical protein